MCDFACSLAPITSAVVSAVVSAVAAELLLVFLFWTALAAAVVLGAIAGFALLERHRWRSRLMMGSRVGKWQRS